MSKFFESDKDDLLNCIINTTNDTNYLNEDIDDFTNEELLIYKSFKLYDENEVNITRNKPPVPLNNCPVETHYGMPKYIQTINAGGRGLKFSIENHPSIKLLKITTISGSEYSDAPDLLKYNQIMDIYELLCEYEELNKINNSGELRQKYINDITFIRDVKYKTEFDKYKIPPGKKAKPKTDEQLKKLYKGNLPKDCGITDEMMPDYCYYKINSNRESQFIIKNHPKIKDHPLNKKNQKTFTFGKGTINEKYNLMIKRLKELDALT